MSVLDHVPVSGKKDYNFLTGDLSFIDEMEQDKQPMNIDERPDFGDTPLPEEQRPTLPKFDPGDVNLSAEEEATFVTEVIDTGASFGLAVLSKGKAEQYMATADQKSRIQKIIRVYCERVGGHIPLWLQLAIILLIVYGSRIPEAIEERKINILQEKIEEQRKKIEALEAENKANELKQEVERRKQANAAAQETKEPVNE